MSLLVIKTQLQLQNSFNIEPHIQFAQPGETHTACLNFTLHGIFPLDVRSVACGISGAKILTWRRVTQHWSVD